MVGAKDPRPFVFAAAKNVRQPNALDHSAAWRVSTSFGCDLVGNEALGVAGDSEGRRTYALLSASPAHGAEWTCTGSGGIGRASPPGAVSWTG